MSLLGIDVGTSGCKAAVFSEEDGCWHWFTRRTTINIRSRAGRNRFKRLWESVQHHREVAQHGTIPSKR
jgi:sugar (pentulose or hexulose) kinase